MNTAAFAVLASLERRGQEIESMDDLAGLRLRHPMMAAVLAIASGSLLGVPPLLGFWGKFYLFVAGIEAGQIVLVVIAGFNSAISAWYYLRLIALPIMAKPSAQAETIVPGPQPWPRVAGIVTAMLVVLLPAPTLINRLFAASESATATSRVSAPSSQATSVARVPNR
jgi:NADH-quinone oxidoreductase subunit N